NGSSLMLPAASLRDASSVVTSKAAIRGHLKSGQWSVAGTSWFYASDTVLSIGICSRLFAFCCLSSSLLFYLAIGAVETVENSVPLFAEFSKRLWDRWKNTIPFFHGFHGASVSIARG
ncbi:MAG: hypothetical protein LC729_00980, partial [Acidobacteria bacterium]|nr:hypothetical protein [Acidobacteriota bacterium]